MATNFSGYRPIQGYSCSFSLPLFGYSSDLKKEYMGNKSASSVTTPVIGHGQYFSWHQDSTYSGFSGDDAVTFWIAFGAVTEDMGPLQYRVGTHALGQLRHEERPEERTAGNMLAFGQTIPPSAGSASASTPASAAAATATAPAWDDDTAFPIATAAPLDPGEASVHNFSLVHRRGKLCLCMRNMCFPNCANYQDPRRALCLNSQLNTKFCSKLTFSRVIFCAQIQRTTSLNVHERLRQWDNRDRSGVNTTERLRVGLAIRVARADAFARIEKFREREGKGGLWERVTPLSCKDCTALEREFEARDRRCDWTEEMCSRWTGMQFFTLSE